jgi:hypothetical protein
MFGNKKFENNATNVTVEKLPGPREIPGLVQKNLIDDKKLDPDLVQLLKSTIRQRQHSEQKVFDIRIFDDADAAARKVQVKDYTTFEIHPDLVAYDGWFNETTKQVELTEKKKITQDVPLFSQEEIQQKIEGLSEPGSTVFFYMARGPSNGGPLGRGAAVVELTPQLQGKKSKKYTVYCANVVDMKPVGNGEKIFASDKAKDIAKWIKDAHHKRLY